MLDVFFQNMAHGRKAFAGIMEPVCEKWNLTMTETDILLFLHTEPELDRAADIVAYRGITKSHVSMSIKCLEERGFLCRKQDGDDRRSVRLALTEAARPAVHDAEQARDAFLSRMLSGVSAEDLEVYRRISNRILQNLTEQQ